MSYWSVLFKAKSFTDLIDRLNMMEEIHRADQRRMNELSEAAQAVAEARPSLFPLFIIYSRFVNNILHGITGNSNKNKIAKLVI